MVLADGTVIRQDYDGLGKQYSEAARLVCDPDEVVLVEDELGRKTEIYPGKSLTRQSEKDSADINVILDRMAKQGIGPVLDPRAPAFLDISEVGSFTEAVRQVREAEEYFMQLDAEDRLRFGNRVSVFLDTVNDPVKLQELIKEGIVVDGSIVGGAVPPGGGGAGAPPAAPVDVK